MDDVLRGLRRLAQVLQIHSSRTEAEWGLTGPQSLALRELLAEPGLALKDLAARLYLHPSTTVGVVDRLEAKGYLARKADPHDRRRLRLHLTAAGSRLARRLEQSGPRNFQADLQRLKGPAATRMGEILNDLAAKLEAGLGRPG